MAGEHTVWRCAECSYRGIDLGTGRVRGGEGYAGLCIPCSIKRADEALAYCPALVDWLVVYLRAQLATERADRNADAADMQREMRDVQLDLRDATRRAEGQWYG